jgi:hypothetical protein
MRLNEEMKKNRILFWVLIGWAALKVIRIIAGLRWRVINKIIPWWLDVII